MRNTRVCRQRVDTMSRCVALATTVLLVLLLTAVPAWAAREVRVGVYGDAPLVSLDAQGRPVGLYVDIVEQIAARNHWHLTYVDGSWNDNLTWLRAGKIDLVLDIAQTPHRLAHYSLNDNPVVPKWSQIYVRRGSAIRTVRDLDGQRVAVNRGDVTFAATGELAKQWKVRPVFVVVRSTSAQFDLLSRGDVAAAATDNIAGIAHEHDRGVVASSILFAPFTTGFGTAKGKNLDLLRAVDRYVETAAATPSSAYSRALAKWLHPTPAARRVVRAPPALIGGLVTAALLALLLLGAAAALRGQVRRRTRELADQNTVLRESEERFKEFAGHFPGFLFMQDEDLRYVFVNRPGDKDGGMPREELLGRTPSQVWDCDDARRAESEVQLALDGHVVDVIEPWAPPGVNEHLHSVYFPIPRDGKPPLAGGLSIDVTEQVEAQQQVGHQAERLRRMLEGAVLAMSHMVESRDPYTAGHERRVAELATAIGEEMGMAGDDLDALRLAGTIHDIGKIAVPAEILAKPGRLSEIEFKLIQGHPTTGFDILADVDFGRPVAEMVLQHHERLDGSGYPRGLHGADMLFEARILAVADVVEAMSSHRPYRAALGMDVALAEVREHAGAKYDADVVAACARLIEEQGFQFTP